MDAKLRQLILQIQEGNQDKYEEVLKLMRPSISKAANRMQSIMGIEYDDIKQEIYIKLYKTIMQYDATKEGPCGPAVYLRYSIMWTPLDLVIRSYQKKNTIYKDTIHQDEYPEDKIMIDYISNLEEEQEQKRIDKVLQRILTEDEYKCFKLFCYNKLTYKQIAKEINKSVKYTDNCIYRAKQKIMTALTTPFKKVLLKENITVLNKILKEENK